MYDSLFHEGFRVLTFLGFSFYREVSHLTQGKGGMKILNKFTFCDNISIQGRENEQGGFI